LPAFRHLPGATFRALVELLSPLRRSRPAPAGAAWDAPGDDDGQRHTAETRITMRIVAL
jgi:hypothetical protein